MPNSWEMRKIEKLTKDALIKDIGEIKGEERFALYLTARKYLVENILDEIKAIIPLYLSKITIRGFGRQPVKT